MKFISADYNKENGHSTVIVQHLGRKFVGEGRFNPEDKSGASEFAGCTYAETRATIKALKYELNIAKNKMREAQDFVKSCECYKDFDPNSPSAKVFYRQLNRRIKRVEDLKNEIKTMQLSLKASIEARYNKIMKILEKKDKKG